MRKIKKRNGFTLIEILLSLGLISLFIVSIFYIYGPVSKQIVVDTSIKNAAIFKIKAEELLNGSQLLNVGNDGYNKIMLSCSSEADNSKECFDKYDLNELYNNRGGKYIEYDFTIRTNMYGSKEGSLNLYGIRDADTCVKIADNFARVYGNVSINNPSSNYSYSEGDEEGNEEYGEHTMKNLINYCEGFSHYKDGDFYDFSISTDVLYKG